METIIRFLIRNFLKGYHLHKTGKKKVVPEVQSQGEIPGLEDVPTEGEKGMED
jgi:hypothetical protein